MFFLNHSPNTMDRKLINEYVSGTETPEADNCAPLSLAPFPQPSPLSSVLKAVLQTKSKLNDAKVRVNRLRFELEQAEAKFDDAWETASMLEEVNGALVNETTQLEDKLVKIQNELKEAEYKVKMNLIELVRVERLVKETSEKLVRLRKAKETLTKEKAVLEETMKRESTLLWALELDLESGAEMKVEVVSDKRQGEASSSQRRSTAQKSPPTPMSSAHHKRKK